MGFDQADCEKERLVVLFAKFLQPVADGVIVGHLLVIVFQRIELDTPYTVVLGVGVHPGLSARLVILRPLSPRSVAAVVDLSGTERRVPVGSEMRVQ